MRQKHKKSILSNLRGLKHKQTPLDNRNLHLLIPATSSNPSFCRTTLSAALLDYPTPILINWHGKEDPKNMFASHLAKVDTILEYLRGVSSNNDNDLVLIVDGYDVWFQLRPEVLIQRYYTVLQQSNERLEDLFDEDVLARHDIKQTVIFGADKKCWPQEKGSMTCNAAPESSLPQDVYGSKTDIDGEFALTRPRWANSGTILGPVSDVRAIFEAASRQIQTEFHGYSDQWYFAEIFAQQEIKRNSLSKRPKDLTKYLGKGSSQQTLSQLVEKAVVDLHMTLDYEASLFHANAFAVEDTEWIVFNSTSDSTKRSNSPKLRIRRKMPSLLPTDIGASRSPLFESGIGEELFDEASSMELQSGTTWQDVQLLANKVTNSVPVLIHLNGNKEIQNEWWGQLWWAQNGWGQKLLKSSSKASRGPLGTTTDEKSGRKTTWWKGSYNSLKLDNGGYWSWKGEWLDFNQNCEKYSNILFEGKSATIEKHKGGWMGPKGGAGLGKGTQK